MNYLKSLKWEMILFSIGCIAMGILMITHPTAIRDIIAVCLAILMFCYAIRHVIEYFRRKDMDGFTGYEIVLAVVFLILGIILITQRAHLTDFLAYLVAGVILISGLMKLENAFDLKRMGRKWVPMLIIALIFVIISIVFIVYPQEEGGDKGDTLVVVSGVAFIFVGALNLISTLAVSGKIKNWVNEQTSSPKVVDVEYEDVDKKEE